jgi:putative hydrolase of the HAD superfamily
MRFTTLFFDLDDTLYPPDTGLWQAIGGRITLYLTERMGFPPDNVNIIRVKYFREYGTTLRGLQANHNVDMDDYLAFVHNVPLAEYIHPDPKMNAALKSISAHKFIFTNADKNHAGRVLEILGLQELFEEIIDVHTIAPYCKPMPGAFELALKAAGNPEPQSCVLLDDQRRITRAASLMGMYTILVGGTEPGEDSQAVLSNLSGLPGLLGGRV